MNMRKWRNKFIICLMIVFVFLSGIFYINRKSIGYVLDYLYFIRVVETNSFRLNSIPTLDTKQIYLNKIMNCKNDREFLNDLIEFYSNYETKGHFNIVDVDSYHRIHQVYKNLIQDKFLLFIESMKNHHKIKLKILKKYYCLNE